MGRQTKCRNTKNNICKKTSSGSGVLSLLLLFQLLILSFIAVFYVTQETLAAKVTMEVYQQSDGKAFGKETSLDIFKYLNEDNQRILAPGFSGSYTFAVYNSAASDLLPYILRFEATNKDDIPLVFSIQKNGEYIFGGKKETEMLPLSELDLGELSLGGKKTDLYTLKWRWDTESDAADTALGIRAGNGEDLRYSLTIKATGTIAEKSLPDKGDKGIIKVLPKTGDDMSILIWIVLILISFSSLLFMLIYKRRKKKEEES